MICLPASDGEVHTHSAHYPLSGQESDRSWAAGWAVVAGVQAICSSILCALQTQDSKANGHVVSLKCV